MALEAQNEGSGNEPSKTLIFSNVKLQPFVKAPTANNSILFYKASFGLQLSSPWELDSRSTAKLQLECPWERDSRSAAEVQLGSPWEQDSRYAAEL
ncbi:hypothetical protein U1Q18_008038 [Sarracenia purpurea var. burkii]